MIKIHIELRHPDEIKSIVGFGLSKILKQAEKLPAKLLRELKQCEKGKNKVEYECSGDIVRSFRI